MNYGRVLLPVANTSQPDVYDPQNRSYLLERCRPPQPFIHSYKPPSKLEKDARQRIKELVCNIHQYALRVTTDRTHAQHIAPVRKYLKTAAAKRPDILAAADAAADKTFANMPSVPFTTMIYSSDNVLLFLYVGLRPVTAGRSFTLCEFKSCADITADAVAQAGIAYNSDGFSVSLTFCTVVLTNVFFHS